MYMFYGPMILVAVAAIVYYTKVKLSESRHEQIVKELETKLRAEKDAKEASDAQ